MLMVLNNLFPVFGLMVVGILLKRFKMTDAAFFKISDRLVYFIFFPAMLFWKIGGAPLDLTGSSGLYQAAICAVAVIYVLSSLYIKFFKVSSYQAGSFSQSCYRFNTYIGVAIILNAFGEEGIKVFGILIGISIPVINVLAVSTLTWFSGTPMTARRRVAQTAKALVANPLILACLSGIIYAKRIGYFPVFIDNTLKLAAFITLPLALLSIGGSLTMAGRQGYFKLSVVSSIFKLLLLPLTGYFFLTLFQVSGLPFKVGMIFFTLPASTALYVLSSQLNSDTGLASAAIALSTILSFFSLSVAMLI
jgi:predicted permease